MTGLDLESFLLLQRADLGAWLLLGVGTLFLGVLAWVSWGSRSALRRCLALSIGAHAGLALFGSTMPGGFHLFNPMPRERAAGEHLLQIKVSPARAGIGPAPDDADRGKDIGAGTWGRPTLDRVVEPMRLPDSKLVNGSLKPDRFVEAARMIDSVPLPREPLRLDAAIPVLASPPPATTEPEPRLRKQNEVSLAPPESPRPANVESLVPPVVRDRPSPVPANANGPLLHADTRQRPARSTERTTLPSRLPELRGPSLPLDRAPVQLPRPAATAADPAALADLTTPPRGRVLSEVPLLYRSRLDANRSALAQKAGASKASEQAVERALDWLSRHQDADGRWDGGTARYDDGTAVSGDDDFTVHCPPGQTCFGECAYWEADTALTGLSLLCYLGAGYTPKEGKFATTVSRGLDFLLSQQQANGDLRGTSRAVGMYCHAMATLALCEAYALTLDERLRDPAEKAVSFLVRARARDGMAWRYAPGASAGDTSILGWVVMALKSARETGIPIPGQDSVQRGTLKWLDLVSDGKAKGLARYQPREPVTPTMTAEAWVCRQFLGVGAPGKSSDEAAAHLLEHVSDRGESNFYYWYYATLAMYQHGAQPWSRWNERTRDRIVGLQRPSGHQVGSWDPDDSLYGPKGGRIYCTTLATLTLEVYYRYLRLYDQPDLPTPDEAKPEAPTPAAQPATAPASEPAPTPAPGPASNLELTPPTGL